MSKGAGGRVRTWITRESLDDFAQFEDIVQEIGSVEDGALLFFQGRVRRTNRGRAVSRLAYEAYGEMAERELSAICRDALERFDVGSIAAAHRVGDLGLGEVSVAIAVTSAHRDDGYRASRWIIETIKIRLPVWKHEHYEDGESHWVGAPVRETEIPAGGVRSE
ncbi:MAG: molybdenum cofactor biosynthesis protein MoaE [Gemmatimonadota bacterium]|uniref:molybdenum cofactor biosynthesis protein MoaE n=1 Tax=Candidatus Palauibacter scopulicola TaxID=3056741 RepID=UPI0023923637|nr:molybdenum cofactor biosynthesis protein MoaE [Candidatus Palauibacter scopulicola]MDE2662935.1 molybdenum cofactor biosynthesis protein MoaE [Candidatus Palauibacter scopulicola]